MHSEERNNCLTRKKEWIRKKEKSDSQHGRNKRLGQKGLGAAKKDTYKKSVGASDRPSSRSPSGMECVAEWSVLRNGTNGEAL